MTDSDRKTHHEKVFGVNNDTVNNFEECLRARNCLNKEMQSCNRQEKMLTLYVSANQGNVAYFVDYVTCSA